MYVWQKKEGGNWDYTTYYIMIDRANYYEQHEDIVFRTQQYYFHTILILICK